MAVGLMPAWVAVAVTWSDSHRPSEPPREPHTFSSVDHDRGLRAGDGETDQDDDEIGCPMDDWDGREEPDPAPGFERWI
jgi:hypothetical protein